MKMKIKAVFKFKPFSPKQKKVLTWWCDGSPVKDKDGIIADGAIRSGKTISMALSFVMWAMFRFNGQNFGMCGKTIGSFRRNVLFWLKIMLRSRGYKVHDSRADNLLIVTWKGKVNYFYIFGGKDERSQDLIQGITLAGIFFDEVALMPESFVNQGTGRCSVDGSKFWFNCNPEGPRHWFKVEWIDERKKKNLLYLHFDMDDNWSLSEEIKQRYRSRFSGLFFKRFILGLWVLAEGVIYDMFNEEVHVGDYAQRTFSTYVVGIDHGTANPCTFGLFGIEGNKAYLVREYWYDSKAHGRQKTDGEYGDDFEAFLAGMKPKAIYVDPSAASFITELRKRKFKVISAKNDVLPGIQFVSQMLQQQRFFIDRNCINTINEFHSYVWDEKAQERGEDAPVKQNDHTMDRNRYALYTYFNRFQAISART
jgi:PBSX family phage terminase large subunit